MLELHDSGIGIILPVRAAPCSGRNAIVGEIGGRIKVAVCVAPEGGKANKAVAEVLAKALGVRKSQVKIRTGETTRDKTFVLTGLTKEDLEGRLCRILS